MPTFTNEFETKDIPMTLFDPYSHARVYELRQEQLARKAHLREKLGVDALPPRFEYASTGNRLVAGFARITGRRSVAQSNQPGAVRPALDS